MINKIKLGLDVGALAIKATFIHQDGKLTAIYKLHKGHPEGVILEIISENKEVSEIAITGSGGKRLADKIGATYIDPAVALIAGLTESLNVRHIIDIGGASLSIVDLDEEGRFSSFRTNSLCAAGTGSFLDEQALRMKLSLDDMSSEQNIQNPPRIAARCAVFAKSDLIHRQQEGYSILEMWSGLCRGMVGTALSTLFRGRKPKGPVLLSGGVVLNREVVRWLKTELDAELIIPADPATFSSRGATRAARPPKKTINWNSLLEENSNTQIPRRPKLKLELSDYPSFDCKKSYVDDGTEVRIHTSLKGDVIIGLDIGSTSTKAAVIDTNGQVAADLYRRTSGDPIKATQKIFAAVQRATGNNEIKIKGIGTTGSGRKMVGAIIGADRIINEITAHAKGAAVTDPDVETIFEIGGQDAKFVLLREGSPHDSNMNYVCAAGTGSFVEEQAGKLEFALKDIGDAVIGTAPPYSTDRCTVFMEQDVHALIRQGFDRREVMGSVLYSVVQNYLNRVVGRRPYSRKKICFMGATARNKGLVAAFEQLLGVQISVSPYCHVMGAYGVAQIVLKEVVLEGQLTKFKGLSVADANITLKREVCDLCSNSCSITRAVLGEKYKDTSNPSWGYLCGRDPEELRVRTSKHFEHFKKRDKLWRQTGITNLEKSTPAIGMPRALLTHSYLPLWTQFFKELGIRVVLSSPTNDKTLLSATDWIGSDFCYPVKLAHGHILELTSNSDIRGIFMPFIVQGEPHDDNFKRSVFCPYNIAFTSIIKASGMCEESAKPLLAPVINFQLSEELIVKELKRELAKQFSVTNKQIEHAWHKALNAQQQFAQKSESIGHEILAMLKEKNDNGIVILGRPYNVCDLGANLNLPQKIADLGLGVLTVDMLPLSDVKIDPLFHNMYWRYGRKILQAATFVANHPRLHAVFLTNFGCGPDSFLQTFVEQIMRGKPMLMLEIDEHSADAGYVTRLEAFKDVIAKIKNEHSGKKENPKKLLHLKANVSQSNIRTLWIPPMHPYGSALLAAALRSTGKPARPLPPETIETFELAKGFCRGTECVPAPSTIGAFLKVLQESDAPELECLFMPSAKGPCRFGQYHTLHRIILDEAGFTKTPIEAWSDESGSYGTDMSTSRKLYNAIVTSDLLYKARCRIRPYAKDRKQFDVIMNNLLSKVISVVEKDGDIVSTLDIVADVLSAVERTNEKKPLVGIVGEIYVRLNTYTNGDLMKTIEDAGGEGWVAPISEWFRYLAFLDKMIAREQKHSFGERIKKTLKNAYMMRKEKILTRPLLPIIGDRLEPPIESTISSGEHFFPRQFDGESILTVGRAIEFAENGADMIINCAPFGCMPGTLTSGMFQRIEGSLGVPIVSLFFDGETDLKPLVRTYLANIKIRNPEIASAAIVRKGSTKAHSSRLNSGEVK